MLVEYHGHGTCTKDETAVGFHCILANVVDLWYSSENGAEKRGPMNNFSSDGCAVLVLAATMFETIVLSTAPDIIPGSFFDALLTLLGCLTLFDLSVGIHGMIFVCDAKHAFKRFRSRLKSGNSNIRIYEKDLTLVNIIDILKHGAGITAQQIKRMFDSDDEQNVPYMVECFEIMGKRRREEMIFCLFVFTFFILFTDNY